MLHLVLRILSGLLCPMFIFSVAVQYNDPDPVRWMAIYGAAALVSGMVAWRGRVPLWLPIAVGVVALGWAIYWGQGVIGQVRFADMFAEFEMHSETIEVARETYGLLIVAGGMLIAALAVLSRPKPAS